MSADCDPFPLLRLPAELRIEIYTRYFRSVKLKHFGRSSEQKSCEQPLALNQTSRQIYNETRLLWPTIVRFSYEKPWTFMDKMSSCHPDIRSRIRDVSIGNQQLVSRSKPSFAATQSPLISEEATYMNLDKLTIFTDHDHLAAHMALEKLIRDGIGWRELRFVSRDSRILRLAHDRTRRHGTKHQTWTEMLTQRDGDESGSTVKLYRAKWTGPTKQVFDPDARTTFEPWDSPVNVPDTPTAMDPFDWSHAQMLLAQDCRKPSMVVVRRGDGVDITK